MKRKNWIWLVLFAVLLSGCSQTTDQKTGKETGEDTSALTETETEAATETEISDDLPDVKFGGSDFRIYTRECCEGAHVNGLYIEDLTGDVVNDAVYTRNLTVEERFDVKIVAPITGIDGDCTALNTAVTAGDDICEVADWHYKHLGDSAAKGYFIDMNSIGVLGMEKPWWYQNVNDAYSVGGHYYIMVGMYDTDNFLDNICMYFNKNLLEVTFPEEDLYAAVKEGTWTADKFMTLAAKSAVDLDGDGAMDPAKDQFAYGQANGYSFAFQFAWQQPVTERDSDGYPVTCINTSHMSDMVERLHAMLFENSENIIEESDEKAVNAFKENREMFQLHSLKAASTQLRDMDADFGILPMPKWNEAQDGYYTHATAHTSAVAIPVTKDNDGFVFAETILEALAAEGYKQVRPAIYEVALKSKYTRDEVSYEMIDIVVHGRTADFAEIFDNWGLTYTLDHLTRQKSSDWASFYQKQTKAQEKAVGDAVALFMGLDK